MNMSRAWPAWGVLCAAALTRLYLAAAVPLTDTTEARFGEMARKMVESGSWLVPQHDYGVPYLAKPPLAMWFSAAGISSFVNRHPTVKVLALSFLLLIGVSLIGDGLGMHIPKAYIYFAMGFSVFVELINLRVRGKTAPVQLHQSYRELERP